MRQRPEQLAQQLTSTLKPVYIISGDETLLVQECCDAVRKACREAGVADREVLHVEPGFDWQQLLGANQAMSLFGERKLIELRLPSGKPGDAGSKALVQYCENLNPDNVLLIICGKVESAATRSKWYKTVDQAGVSVQAWPVDARQLPRWIEQRLQSRGLRASPDAVQLLAERNQGNLLACAQEIEKLRLYSTADTIDIQTVAQAVADNARYDVFNLVDTALQGRAAHSLKTLAGLRAEGTEPPVVLWALARELRTLYRCASQLEKGNSIDRALQNAGVWEKRKPLLAAALKRLSRRRLSRLMQLAARIDASIKGMESGNSWDMLGALALYLAGAKPRL